MIKKSSEGTSDKTHRSQGPEKEDNHRKEMVQSELDLSEDEGIVEFIASTSRKDSEGDVVEQNFEYPDHIPLLWAHSEGSDDPPPVGKIIGHRVDSTTKDYDRLILKAKVDLKDPLGRKLWHKIKKGYVGQFSIGLEPIEEPEEMKGGRFRFPKSELVECSVVGIGANRDTEVLRTKSYTKDEVLTETFEGRRNRKEDEKVLEHINELSKFLKGDMERDKLGPCPMHKSEESETSQTVTKPYDGPNDPELMEDFPALEGMSQEDREQWLAVFEDILLPDESNIEEAASQAFAAVDSENSQDIESEETMDAKEEDVELEEGELDIKEGDEKIEEKRLQVEDLILAYPELEDEDAERVDDLLDELNERIAEFLSAGEEEPEEEETEDEMDEDKEGSSQGSNKEGSSQSDKEGSSQGSNKGKSGETEETDQDIEGSSQSSNKEFEVIVPEQWDIENYDWD